MHFRHRTWKNQARYDPKIYYLRTNFRSPRGCYANYGGWEAMNRQIHTWLLPRSVYCSALLREVSSCSKCEWTQRSIIEKKGQKVTLRYSFQNGKSLSNPFPQCLRRQKDGQDQGWWMTLRHRHNSTNTHMNSQRLWQCTWGLLKFNPDKCPVTEMEK